MIYPTIGELIVLWVLFCIVGGFFIGYRTIAIINFIILILSIAGFFMGIGIHFFNSII